MKFHIARMSFIPSAQKTLLKPKYECTPVELAENLLKNNPQYIRTKQKGFISLYFGDFIFGDDGRLLSLKLGKSTDVILPKYDGGKYHDEIEKIYPHVNFLWDRDEQVILIEKNTGVFRNYETVIKSIECHLNNLLAKFEYRIFIEPLTEKVNFWKVIQTYDYIYEVNFELHMPNFFGKTQETIRDILKMYQGNYNATGISTKISNPDGRLIISENDPQINADLDWITEGGGAWYVKAKKEGSKKKATLTSTKSQNIKTEDTSIELENYNADEVISIFTAIRPKYSTKNKQEEDNANN